MSLTDTRFFLPGHFVASPLPNPAAPLQYLYPMKPTIAIIGDDALASELEQLGLATLRCPADDPRGILRWVMDLSPSDISFCIIQDSEGRATAALTTALDPAICPITWAPSPNQVPRLLSLLKDSPILLIPAESSAIAARAIASLAGRPAAPLLPAAQAHPPEPTTKPVPVPSIPEEDLAAYRELETQMSARVKDIVKPAPVPVQQSAIDFSVPLRQLMTAGSALANRHNHPQVEAIHYLASLDDPYRSALKNAGLNAQALLAEFTPPPADAPSDTVISDEIFDAVRKAKTHAREEGLDCIRVTDFLRALFETGDTTIATLLVDHGLAAEDMLNALAGLGTHSEACQGSFFAPSSMDQDGFYEFNAQELQSVKQRLETLPGFHKAAKRVAESRQAHLQPSLSAGPVSPSHGAIQRAAAPPPETPVILKLDSDFPPVEAIEQIADQLLEGQVIAFPSDVMLALAADAANPAAVERLREAAGLSAGKPLSILINSTSQLKHLVKADLDQLEPMLDELWPGPLTLIFKAAPGLGRHLVSGGNIAIRQPADNTSLAILSMLGRPLAVTSWDQPGGGASVAENLTGVLGMAVQSSDALLPKITTIVDLTKTPWQIVREGAVPSEDIQPFNPSN